MRDCGAALGEQRFDLACILLGSLSHVLTTEDALRCFRGVHGALSAGGVRHIPPPRRAVLPFIVRFASETCGVVYAGGR